ncbi:MAG: hypothetical protein AAF533_06585 [Acidobacteriota bacterium]
MSVTNYGDPLAEPPIYLDDSPVQIGARVHFGLGVMLDTCERTSGDDLALELGQDWLVQLDDAHSPYANGPVTWMTTFPVEVPEDLQAGRVLIELRARNQLTDVTCEDTACAQVRETPTFLPHAEFVSPIGQGVSGGSASFEIQVHRNDYDVNRPLQLVVESENPADPRDVFPVSPAALTDTGVSIVGPSARIEMNSSFPIPCSVGTENELHLKLMDGPVVVWDSRVTQPDGAGAACVGEAPLAHYELVSVNDGPPGPLVAHQDNEIVVRAYGRNPAVGMAMEDVALWIPRPDGVELLESWVHFHDNPLDEVDPSRDELTAHGAVIEQDDEWLRVRHDRIDHRFLTDVTDPPIFHDLFQADLRLRISARVLRSESELVLPGALFLGRQVGRVRHEVAGDLVIPTDDSGMVFEPPQLGLPEEGRSPSPRASDVRRGSERRRR